MIASVFFILCCIAGVAFVVWCIRWNLRWLRLVEAIEDWGNEASNQDKSSK